PVADARRRHYLDIVTRRAKLSSGLGRKHRRHSGIIEIVDEQQVGTAMVGRLDGRGQTSGYRDGPAPVMSPCHCRERQDGALAEAKKHELITVNGMLGRNMVELREERRQSRGYPRRPIGLGDAGDREPLSAHLRAVERFMSG
ncbi:MAG: hypothetical protein Q7J32_15005, partial [Sphingomonadaceae bacterium]|nr:hypothetical protein [Sphingomonadaceae bacterium]